MLTPYQFAGNALAVAMGVDGLEAVLYDDDQNLDATLEQLNVELLLNQLVQETIQSIQNESTNNVNNEAGESSEPKPKQK